MLTLRCSQRLLVRLAVKPDPKPPVSTTLLGDWFAHLVAGRKGTVLFVSEKTLLPVVVAAPDVRALLPCFREGLSGVLMALGVAAPAVERELAQMVDVTFAKTNNRRVMGSMNDFVFLVEGSLDADPSLLRASLDLARAPCRPIGMDRPEDRTRGVFAGR